MLSDEEKKVIDLLKNIDKQKCMMLKCPVVKNNIERQLKIIELNRTIRKQSKEIEQLNKSDAIFAISNLIAENKELKEKNKWKPIKEYNRQKYDWVLVKYFDGDYECVPEVAEQRIDGKWYTSEKQIPFEVKYFFDMQSLLGKE